MSIYYSEYTFGHMVFPWHAGERENGDSDIPRLPPWLDSWGKLAFSHIRSIEINVSDHNNHHTHRMRIDLRNIDSPVSLLYRSPSGFNRCWKEDVNQADVNALVIWLLMVLPDGKRVFTPERFKALLKGL